MRCVECLCTEGLCLRNGLRRNEKSHRPLLAEVAVWLTWTSMAPGCLSSITLRWWVWPCTLMIYVWGFPSIGLCVLSIGSTHWVSIYYPAIWFTFALAFDLLPSDLICNRSGSWWGKTSIAFIYWCMHSLLWYNDACIRWFIMMPAFVGFIYGCQHSLLLYIDACIRCFDIMMPAFDGVRPPCLLLLHGYV